MNAVVNLFVILFLALSTLFFCTPYSIIFLETYDKQHFYMPMIVGTLSFIFAYALLSANRKRLESNPESEKEPKGGEKQEMAIEDKQNKNHNLPLEAYKLLVSQLQQEDSLSWKRIEIFLIVNGGLIGILGLGRSSGVVTPPVQGISLGISLAICAMGFFMCFLWLIIVKRSEAFYNHWYDQLTFLEKEYLTPIKIFQVAEEYFAKGKVMLGQKKLDLDRVSRLIHIYHALIVAVIIFMLVWLALAIYLCKVKP